MLEHLLERRRAGGRSMCLSICLGHVGHPRHSRISSESPAFPLRADVRGSRRALLRKLVTAPIWAEFLGDARPTFCPLWFWQLCESSHFVVIWQFAFAPKAIHQHDEGAIFQRRKVPRPGPESACDTEAVHLAAAWVLSHERCAGGAGPWYWATRPERALGRHRAQRPPRPPLMYHSLTSRSVTFILPLTLCEEGRRSGSRRRWLRGKSPSALRPRGG